MPVTNQNNANATGNVSELLEVVEEIEDSEYDNEVDLSKSKLP